MTDLGDPEQVEKAEREQRNREMIAREELALILKQREVRNFLWTLLEECGIYDLGGESLHDLAVSKGMRSLGHKIIDRIDTAVPHTYMKMYTENRKDENANE